MNSKLKNYCSEMENTTCIENQFNIKVKHLQDLIAGVPSQKCVTTCTLSHACQFDFMNTLYELKENEIFLFYYKNNQSVKSCTLRAIEILLNSSSDGSSPMTKNEALRYLINLLRTTSFGETTISQIKENDQYAWQKQLYEQFFTSVVRLINVLVLENDPLLVSTLYHMVIYAIETIGLYNLIQHDFINNFLVYLEKNAITYPHEFWTIICKIVKIILDDDINYNHIVLIKQVKFIEFLRTLKDLTLKLTEGKFYWCYGEVNASEIKILKDYLEIIIKCLKSNPNSVIFNDRLPRLYFDLYGDLQKRLVLKSSGRDNDMDLLYGCMDYSYRKQHFSKLMEIDGELPMVSFCHVMVALITTIQLMNTHDRCSKAMKVSNKAMEIIANIIINLRAYNAFQKNLFVNVYWDDIKPHWSKFFMERTHDNCSLFFIDFFCTEFVQYDSKYSDEIKYFLDRFSELLKLELTTGQNLMGSYSLSSLSCLFYIIKDYEILPIERCDEVFDLQIALCEKYDLSIFINIAAKFYGDMLNRYSNDMAHVYYLDKRDIWIPHLNKVLEKFNLQSLTGEEKANIKANIFPIKRMISGMVNYLEDEHFSEKSKPILENLVSFMNEN